MSKFNILQASENMVYTNGETFGTIIYLSYLDSADNWYQITIEEAEEMKQKKEEELKQLYGI